MSFSIEKNIYLDFCVKTTSQDTGWIRLFYIKTIIIITLVVSIVVLINSKDKLDFLDNIFFKWNFFFTRHIKYESMKLFMFDKKSTSSWKMIRLFLEYKFTAKWLLGGRQILGNNIALYKKVEYMFLLSLLFQCQPLLPLIRNSFFLLICHSNY